MKTPLALLAVALLTGCSGTRGLIRELKNDPATVSVEIVHPYGSVRFIRTNPTTNQTVTVDPRGSITISQGER